MQVFNELNENKGLSLALGFFDGVHLGHQAVVKNAVDFAHQCNSKSAVITFQDHPLCFFYNLKPQYIIRRKDKIDFLKALGVDYVYFLKFDDYLAQMSAQQYLDQVLIRNFAPVGISTGFNHYFGSKKSGDINMLKDKQNDYGYKYFEVPTLYFNDEVVSSTAIRNALLQGDVLKANSMLGYNYFLEEVVQEGQKIGRTIGFKTANLIYPENLLEPQKGVYKVKVNCQGELFDGIANFGLRPTVTDVEQLVLEVHILDFDNDIYGEKIKVEFVKKIRDEQKFNSLEELKNQIKKDIIDSGN